MKHMNCARLTSSLPPHTPPSAPIPVVFFATRFAKTFRSKTSSIWGLSQFIAAFSFSGFAHFFPIAFKLNEISAPERVVTADAGTIHCDESIKRKRLEQMKTAKQGNGTQIFAQIRYTYELWPVDRKVFDGWVKRNEKLEEVEF